jgi:hypothetical protein
MIRQFLKTSLLGLVFFLTAPFSVAHAESINGGWLADNGDLIFMVKSTKGKVIALDISDEKQLRYVFTGNLIGNQLQLTSRDGGTTLNATINGETLEGTLSPADTTPEPLNAKLYLGYNGSNYDGVWKTDGVESYLFYATLKIKGAVTTLVPYFAINSDQTVSYNLFTGSPPSTDQKGNINFVGISADYTLLKMTFLTNSTANGMFIKGDEVTKFTTTKTYSVTKKSGEF